MTNQQMDNLLTLFDITPEDLEANQNGVLADKQKNHLNKTQHSAISSGSALTIGTFVIGLLLIGSFFVVNNRLFALTCLIGGVVSLGVALQSWRKFHEVWQAYKKDIEDGEVKMVEGDIRLLTRDPMGKIYRQTEYTNHHALIGPDTDWKCFVQIGVNQYKINQSQYFGLKHNGNYRLYYVPHSKHVVSMITLQSSSQENQTIVSPLFDPFMIASNREGRLTELQIEEFKADQERKSYYWLPFFYFFFIAPFLVILVDLNFAIIISAGLIPILFVIARMLTYPRLNMPENPTIKQKCGTAHKSTQRLERSEIKLKLQFNNKDKIIQSDAYKYILNINEQKFTVTQEHFEQFTSGQKYCVYYIAETNSIVSAEEILD